MSPFSSRAARFARPFLFTAILSSLLSVVALGQSHRPTRPLSGVALPVTAAPANRPAPVAHRTHSKLTTKLQQLASAVPQIPIAPATGALAPQPKLSVANLPVPVRAMVQSGHMRINQRNQVQVYIGVNSVSDANLKALHNAGASVEISDRKRSIVQASLPVALLESVSSLSFVRRVDLPIYAVRHSGSIDSQGDAIVKADQVREQLKVTGKGVRVGVISDGIGGIFAVGCTTCPSLGPVETGDLPAATGTRDENGILTATSGGLIAKSFRADGDLEAGLDGYLGAEGTALLEVVYDIAPGAQLYFANVSTDIEFNAATDWLAANTDVVVDDLGFFSPPYDGTSSVSAGPAAALNNDSNPARTLITSVGNEADSHYLETYTPSASDGASWTGETGKLHVFQATARTTDYCRSGPLTEDVIVLPPGGVFSAIVSWDDPWNAPASDYDAYVFDEDGNLVDWSIDSQDGTEPDQHPVEYLAFQNLTAVGATYYIVIQNWHDLGPARKINIFYNGGYGLDCDQNTGIYPNHFFNTVSSSVLAHSDAGGTPVSVLSVGAIDAWPEGNINIESYSSQGPTLDGRMKPDVAGIDGVSITGAAGFYNPFYGTSAAAPHVAGVAALLLESSPCLKAGASGAKTPAQARQILRDAITHNAFDLGDPGPDNVFGAGRLDALASATPFVPTAATTGDKVVPATAPTGASVPVDGSASSDPNSCPLTYSWSGDCGTGSGVRPSLACPIGVNNVTLAVTNNGVTAVQASAKVTVTDFAVSAPVSDAAVHAAQSATYTVAVAPQGGAFAAAVALTCTTNAPSATCTVSPATVTPGSSTPNATVTINTNGTAGGSYTATVTGTSGTLTHAAGLTLAVSDFTTGADVTTASVTKGASASYTVKVGNVAAGGAFTTPIAMSCTTTAPKSFCSVAPVSVTPGSGSQNVTVTVTTSAGTVAALSMPANPAEPHRHAPGNWAFSTLGIAAIGIIGSRKSKRMTMVIVLLVVLASIGMFIGCGGGGSSTKPVADPGTAAGSYTVTVSGTAGALVHSVQLTLTVQ